MPSFHFEQQELFNLLKQCGAERLPSGTGHNKYRLPNGKLFVYSKTPSAPSFYVNALATIRRELRSTHPDLARTWGRNDLPKNKRTTNNTLGDLVALKGLSLVPIDPASAIPGAQVKDEFEIIDAPPPVVVAKPAQPEPVETLVYHPDLRVRCDPPPRPSAPKTLSSDQLKEANRLLHEQGQAAMDKYLGQCREGLVQVTSTILAERAIEPPTPHHTFNEEDEMSIILERARQELSATTDRIATYGLEIAKLKELQDADVIKQAQLEQYIAKHVALASEAAELLTILPPPPSPPPVQAIRPSAVSKAIRHKTPRSTSFGIQEVRERVFPALRRDGKTSFDNADVARYCESVGLGTIGLDAVNRWLLAAARGRQATFHPTGKGQYQFNDVRPVDTAEHDKAVAFG
jgi:hypothetical protein